MVDSTAHLEDHLAKWLIALTMSHDNLEIAGSILGFVQFLCTQSDNRVRADQFQSLDSHGVLAQTSPSPVHTESELCYVGVPAKLAPASLHGLTRTLHKLAWTLLDSMPFHIRMVWNTWGTVKTSEMNSIWILICQCYAKTIGIVL